MTDQKKKVRGEHGHDTVSRLLGRLTFFSEGPTFVSSTSYVARRHTE